MGSSRYLVLAIVLMAPALRAETSLSGLSELPAGVPTVLTPARLSQPQSEVPASVTIIDRDVIEATGAREIYQVLQLVPGMAALDVDGNKPTVSYHPTQARDIRRMLVLVDGRSMYQPGLARVLWDEFPLEVEDVERIEVTRGPAAAAYGANAFSAVINIITRHPADVHGTTFATRNGNNGVGDWRVTSAGHRDRDAIRVTVAQRQDDGYDQPFFDEDELAYVLPRDSKTIRTFNLRYVHDLDRGAWEVLAGGSRLSRERPWDTSYEDVIAAVELPKVDSERLFAQVRFNHDFSARHQFKAQLYGQQQDGMSKFTGCLKEPGTDNINALGGIWYSKELRDIYEQQGRDIDATIAAAFGGPDPSILNRLTILGGSGAGPLCTELRFDIHEQRTALELQDTYVFTDWLRAVAGAEVREDRVYSETYLGGTETNVSSRVFGNVEIRLPARVNVNLGGYWEEDQINGGFFSPRTAINWTFLPGQTLRAVYAESLRTMDIYEKKANLHFKLHGAQGAYASDPQGLLGWSDPELFITQNADGLLDPETIKSREIGYFALFGALELDVRYFREDLDDLVSGALNEFEFEPNNEGNVLIEGREAQLGWRVHPNHLLRLSGAHIHTSSENVDRGQERIEKRLAAEDSASMLWRYDVTDNWMVSTVWHLVQYHNVNELARRKYEYQRGDLNVGYRRRLGSGEMALNGVFQKDLTKDPVVFEENVYEDQTRYWVGVSFTF